jgi:hypothetical protein
MFSVAELRIARIAGANHLMVSFVDAELEKARQVAQAAAPAPANKAAVTLITERNSKRDRVTEGIDEHQQRVSRCTKLGEFGE